ncbi:uncharacterized protein LOC126739479 [Anthonomus grandis grandis]|uniref:uncharacterized protein LOC126739479 n=1 Tax=Anthonomus grandis grandis TaxID=2921223 RepID=UPI002166266A|nr:uncharacterized protein LOC126739479 [Anthonomus grandis grandis]
MMSSNSDIEVMSDDLDPDYSDSANSDNEVKENKTRKRKINKHLWKRVQRKSNLNKGLACTSKSGINMPARRGYECDCKNRCTSKISVEEKANILDKFNNLADKNVQDSYLFGVRSVARRRPDIMKKRLLGKGHPIENILTDNELIQTSKRNSSFHYKIILAAGREIMVCKKALAGLHGIKFGRIDRIGQAKKSNSAPPTDKRSLSEGSRVLKKPEALIQQIESHINSFPIRISHYTRNRSQRKFLSPDLSVMKMRELYVEKYNSEKYRQWKADNKTKFEINYDFYLHIFNTKFNLSFGKPKTDVCNACDRFKNQIDAAENPEGKARLNQEHSVQQAKAQKFYDDLKRFSEQAKTDEKMDVISFDYQQNLPVPVLPIGDIFYKRQLWVYNQCFYSAKTGHSYMYMYNEVEGKKVQMRQHLS